MPGAISLNHPNISFNYIFHKDTHSSHGVRLVYLLHSWAAVPYYWQDLDRQFRLMDLVSS